MRIRFFIFMFEHILSKSFDGFESQHRNGRSDSGGLKCALVHLVGHKIDDIFYDA